MIGRVWVYGDNVDTDMIIPARYLNTTDPKELAKHVMEDSEKPIASKIKNGDIIVAGKNFGSGSSREHAPLAIKSAGVSVVVAESFARIFFRNAINIGLPVVECNIKSLDLKDGDELSVDLEKGFVLFKDKKISFQPLPPFIMKLLNAGGLVEYVRREK